MHTARAIIAENFAFDATDANALYLDAKYATDLYIQVAYERNKHTSAPFQIEILLKRMILLLYMKYYI